MYFNALRVDLCDLSTPVNLRPFNYQQFLVPKKHSAKVKKSTVLRLLA